MNRTIELPSIEETLYYLQTSSKLGYKVWSERYSDFTPTFPPLIHQQMRDKTWKEISEWWKENNISSYEKSNGYESHDNGFLYGFDTVPGILNFFKKKFPVEEVKWSKDRNQVTLSWDLDRVETEWWNHSLSIPVNEIPDDVLSLSDEEISEWVLEEFRDELMVSDIVDSSYNIPGFGEGSPPNNFRGGENVFTLYGTTSLRGGTGILTLTLPPNRKRGNFYDVSTIPIDEYIEDSSICGWDVEDVVFPTNWEEIKNQ